SSFHTDQESTMIQGIEPLFQQIADSIAEAILEDWTTATMEAIFYSGSSTYFGEYRRTSDGKPRDFPTTAQGERAFRDLRKKFKEAAKRLWGQARFEFHADGKFNIKWVYENCDENGDTIFNEEREMKRHEERRKRLSAD